MLEHSQYPPGSQDSKTQKTCVQVVKKLVPHDGNRFAMCLICNSEGHTHFSVNGLPEVTPYEALAEIQRVFDEMRAELNENN